MALLGCFPLMQYVDVLLDRAESDRFDTLCNKWQTRPSIEMHSCSPHDEKSWTCLVVEKEHCHLHDYEPLYGEKSEDKVKEKLKEVSKRKNQWAYIW